MNLKRLIEEGRALDDSAREIGGPAWRERRITWLSKELTSALPPEDWRDLGLSLTSAQSDADASYLKIKAGDFQAFFENSGVSINYIGVKPIRVLEGLHTHHPVDNHRQLVQWLADIFATTKEEPTDDSSQ